MFTSKVVGRHACKVFCWRQAATILKGHPNGASEGVLSLQQRCVYALCV